MSDSAGSPSSELAASAAARAARQLGAAAQSYSLGLNALLANCT